MSTQTPLTAKEVSELKDYVEDGGDCPVWLQEWAADYYCDVIPYGTLCGDTATIDEWLSDRIEWVEDHFGQYLDSKKVQS